MRLFSDGLAELYAPDDTMGRDFPVRVVGVAARIVGADSCSYNHLDGPRLLAWYAEPAGIGVFTGSEQQFRQHLPEHPVLACHLSTGNGRALRISDFLSDRQYRSLGLYCDFYRAAEVNYQLAITVPAPGGGLIGVALNRCRHDFSAEDLELLDLLRVHIQQAAALIPPPRSGSWSSSVLTPRQARILQLVADGQSDRGIARTLGISTRTVQAHLQHAYRALDATSRTEALARLEAPLGRAAPARELSGRLPSPG